MEYIEKLDFEPPFTTGSFSDFVLDNEDILCYTGRVMFFDF